MLLLLLQILATTPLDRVVDAAREQVGVTRYYDSAYRRIGYPGGDLPMDRGVCTDVIIRAFRKGADVDLQKLVHEDMRRHFSAYPKIWGLRRPDPNIDHRRVPNLQTFFRRSGKAVPISRRSGDYRPGDLVTWRLTSGVPHIGIVSDKRAAADRFLIVHNIGAGAQLEDVLFSWEITGHYRYF